MPLQHAPNIIIDSVHKFLSFVDLVCALRTNQPTDRWTLSQSKCHLTIFPLSITYSDMFYASSLDSVFAFCIRNNAKTLLGLKMTTTTTQFCFHVKRFTEIGFRRFSRWLSWKIIYQSLAWMESIWSQTVILNVNDANVLKDGTFVPLSIDSLIMKLTMIY